METLRLLDWRKHRFLSQAELAERSGISKRAIVALESDKPPEARGKTVRKLAEALGIPPKDLYRLPAEQD